MQTASSASTKKKLLIHKGQIFKRYEDFHPLFGIINPEDTLWYQPVPNIQNLIVWAPEYNHPNWYNSGDSTRLLPTITEYWMPANLENDSTAIALTRHMNREGYDLAKRTNDIRITFMQNLNDSGFVFLGVYRFSLTYSDTTRVVWERIADECDVNHLDQLLKYRN